MRKLLLPLAVCAPVVANADLMLLKYEGTVSGIESEGPAPNTYSIGDPVSGRLIIDTSLAHQYAIPSIPLTSTGSGRSAATYAGFPVGSADFITGRPTAPGERIADRVTIFNNDPVQLSGGVANQDRFSVIDGFELLGMPQGPLLVPRGQQDLFTLTVSRFTESGHLFQDTALEQTFDLTPAEGTRLSGGITRTFGAAVGSFKQFVDMTFSHVSLGVCHKT